MVRTYCNGGEREPNHTEVYAMVLTPMNDDKRRTTNSINHL